MLFQYWASVEDDGPTLKQHWVNAGVCWVYRVGAVYYFLITPCEHMRTPVLHVDLPVIQTLRCLYVCDALIKPCDAHLID